MKDGKFDNLGDKNSLIVKIGMINFELTKIPYFNIIQ